MGLRPLLLCIHEPSKGLSHQALLQRHGYRLITATTPAEGLSVFNKNAVDAIILDLGTPGRSAAPVLRRMKQMKPHIPVVLVRPSARASSGKLPADAVVLRSDAPARVLDVLDHLLNVRFPFFTRWFGNWKHRAGA